MKKNYSELLLFIIVLLVGICLTIWADKVTKLVSILLGVIAVIYGLSALISYFSNKEKVFNDNMEAVTALCYKGYSSKEEKNYYKSFKAEYQMVDTKDSTHTLETFYLKVVAPAKK